LQFGDEQSFFEMKGEQFVFPGAEMGLNSGNQFGH